MLTRTAKALAACAVALSASATPASAAPRLTIGAIGDSISVGFDASYPGNNYQFSWSTGNSGLVASHYLRLKAANPGYDVRAYNEAVAGASTVDMGPQVQAILQHPLDFLTITVGANDICDGSVPLPQTLRNLREIFRTLIAARPSIRILIVGVPDVYRLYQTSAPFPGCTAVWRNPVHPLCNPVLGAGLSDAERIAFRDQVLAQGAAIKNLVHAEFAANVRFADIGARDYSPEDVSSVDCFHPSIDGQRKLADATWDAWN